LVPRQLHAGVRAAHCAVHDRLLAIDGFGGVLWTGNSLTQLLPTLRILLGTTAVAMTIAVWRFNRSRLFD
jgi:hypothetical protein